MNYSLKGKDDLMNAPGFRTNIQNGLFSSTKSKPDALNYAFQDQPMNADSIRIEPYGLTTMGWVNQHNYQLHKLRLQHIKRKEGTTFIPETPSRKGSETTCMKNRLIVNRKALQQAEEIDSDEQQQYSRHQDKFDKVYQDINPRSTTHETDNSHLSPVYNNISLNNTNNNADFPSKMQDNILPKKYQHIRRNSEEKSLNRVVRSRTLQKIASENQDILYRIQNKRSEYSAVKLLKTSQEQEKLLANVSRFKKCTQSSRPLRIGSAKPAQRTSEEKRPRSYSKPQNSTSTGNNWNMNNQSATYEKEQFSYLNSSSRNDNSFSEKTNQTPKIFRTFQNKQFSSTQTQNFISSINKIARQGGYFSAQEQMQKQEQWQRMSGGKKGFYDNSRRKGSSNGFEDREVDFNGRVQLFRKQKYIGRDLMWIEVSQGENGYYVVVFSEIDKKTFRLPLSDEQAEIVFEQIDFDFDRLPEILAIQNGNMVLNLLKEDGQEGGNKDKEFVKVNEVLRRYSSKSQHKSREDQSDQDRDNQIGKMQVEKEYEEEEQYCEEEIADGENNDGNEEGEGEEEGDEYSEDQEEFEENQLDIKVEGDKNNDNDQEEVADLEVQSQGKDSKKQTEISELEREQAGRDQLKSEEEEEQQRKTAQDEIKMRQIITGKQQIEVNAERQEEEDDQMNEKDKNKGDYEKEDQQQVESQHQQQNEDFEGTNKSQSEDQNDQNGENQQQNQETDQKGDYEEEEQKEKEDKQTVKLQTYEGQDNQGNIQDEHFEENSEKQSEAHNHEQYLNNEENIENIEGKNQDKRESSRGIIEDKSDEAGIVQLSIKHDQIASGEEQINYNAEELNDQENKELLSNQKQQLHQIEENHGEDGNLTSPSHQSESIKIQQQQQPQ